MTIVVKPTIIGLVGSLFFAGWTISCFFIPRLSDRNGRKWFIIVNLIIQLLSLIAIVFSKNLVFLLAGMFVMGFTTTGKGTLNYLYGTEILTESKKSYIATIIGATDSSILVFASLYYKYISVWWKPLGVMGIMFNILAIISYSFLPESPLFYYSTK